MAKAVILPRAAEFPSSSKPQSAKRRATTRNSVCGGVVTLCLDSRGIFEETRCWQYWQQHWLNLAEPCGVSPNG
jgi:hypothetical protein